MNAFWIILTASLVAICCALLGCFLVLRKMSMVGDAISHAVLPGIVIPFVLSIYLPIHFNQTVIIIGASLMGLFCTFLIEILSKKAKVQGDAAIGMVFTFLFAVGVILIARYAGNVHLDQDCVLYGEILMVPFDLPTEGTFLDFVPIQVWILFPVTLLLIGLIVVGYRGFFLTTFDPEYAETIGISTSFWHYLLMGAVSLTTVVSFESVGAILVVGFLVIPAATAYLLTDKLPVMLVLACLTGMLASLLGYYLAVLLDASIAGAITTVMGILFMLVFFFSPSHGLLAKKRQAAK